MKLLFHVQHLLGIGHQRRAEALARGLMADGVAVTVLAGGLPIPGEDWSGAAVIRLPPAHAADGDFRRLVTADGRPIDDVWRAERSARILAAFARVGPDVVLIEGYPFARRQFAFELDPLIRAASATSPRPRIVASIRDVLVARDDPKRVNAVVSAVRDSFDLVLVHGDPAVVRLDASFSGTPLIADKIRYTGYVAPPAPATSSGDRAGVLVSVGGGAVGADLLRAALAARPLTALADAPWRLLTGPQMPVRDAEEIAAAAPPGVTVERFRADLPALLGHALVSISQAGYNTVLDVLGAGARAVLVPFAAPGETEQSLRAELLERAGRAVVAPETVDGRPLDGVRLAAAITRALATPEPAAFVIDRDGARRTAEILGALVNGAKP